MNSLRGRLLASNNESNMEVHSFRILSLSHSNIYATGDVSPKIAKKFKKPSPSNKDSDLVPVDEEPVTKGKQVKRSIKKSSTKPAAGVVIREAHVEKKSKSKEKEKVDVTHGKGIELLSEVALTEEAQMKEERRA
ncbi:hypothetical protein Tco_0935548 [Tanacetum coccineum]